MAKYSLNSTSIVFFPQLIPANNLIYASGLEARVSGFSGSTDFSARKHERATRTEYSRLMSNSADHTTRRTYVLNHKG